MILLIKVILLIRLILLILIKGLEKNLKMDQVDRGVEEMVLLRLELEQNL